MKTRTSFSLGLLAGLLLAAGVAIWWTSSPSESEVERTVISTIQQESPASFLVTGTIDMSVTVRVDSSGPLVWDWVVTALKYHSKLAVPLLVGTSSVRIRVPGRVSYGFEVDRLTPEMIGIEDRNVVRVDIPELSVHSVDPDLSRLEIESMFFGWMRLFPSEVHEEVRIQALSDVEKAFHEQAEQRLSDATQPRVNTARALEKMLTPPLKATGMSNPRFRIRVGDRLSLEPYDGEGANFQK